MKYLDALPTEQWVEERKTSLGGSEVAAVLGQSDFITPLKLWMIKKGLIPASKGNAVTEFGNVFEPIMAEKFTQITGLKTRNAPKTYVHAHHTYLRGNIDRQIMASPNHPGTGLLELKTTTSYRLKNLDGPYPLEWKYQIQLYLALTGYEYAYLFIYERDTAEYHKPIILFRDQRFIDDMVASVARWWNRHIISGVRPDPIDGEDRMLLFPQAKEDEVVEATPKTYGYYTELLDVRQRIERLENLEEHYKNLLKDYLKDAERMVSAGRNLVTWKNSTANRLDTIRLKKEHPEMYTQYCVEATSRRFLVNKPK
jgi:putative phage-type endonuclease